MFRRGTAARSYFRNNIVNREFTREESEFPSVQVFAHGLEFLERNRDTDNWLVQIECKHPSRLPICTKMITFRHS